MVMLYKTKQEKVISLEALNQAIEEEEEQHVKEQILQGVSSVTSPKRQAESERTPTLGADADNVQ